MAGSVPVAVGARGCVAPTSTAGGPASCPEPGRPGSEEHSLSWSCSAGGMCTAEACLVSAGSALLSEVKSGFLCSRPGLAESAVW